MTNAQQPEAGSVEYFEAQREHFEGVIRDWKRRRNFLILALTFQVFLGGFSWRLNHRTRTLQRETLQRVEEIRSKSAAAKKTCDDIGVRLDAARPRP